MLPALPLKTGPSATASSSSLPMPSPSPATPSFAPSPGLPLPSLDWSLPISQLLREGTKRAHEDVEHSPGASRLAKAELGKEEYARWCVALWCVYDALETALSENSFNPVLSPTFHPSLLSRALPLSADISALLSLPSPSPSAASPIWQSHPAAHSLLTAPPPQLTAYVGRLTKLGQESPERLLAHAYVRYLGDLSGGQIIRRRLAKSLNLPSLASSASEADEGAPAPGLSFFSFPSLSGDSLATSGEMRKIKDWFRAGMDQGVADDVQLKVRLVEEANEAFRLNAGLFGMLDEPYVPAPSSVPGTKEEKLEEVYSPLSRPGQQTAVSSSEPKSGGFALSSVVAFIIAAGLAHFLLVTMGFTGQKGWEKFELVQGWVRSKLEL